jgi:hypothetical protein
MMNRKRTAVLLLLFGALLLTIVPALAGGWAVVTVENLPGDVHAGQNVHLEFSVRQHGRDLTHDVAPILRANNPQTGERLIVEAAALKQKGYFAVDVLFPSAGTWEWRIDPVLLAGELELLPLTVLPAAATTLTTTPATTAGLATSTPLIRTALQIAAVALLMAAIVTAIPRRGRVAVSVVSHQ